MFFTGSCLAQQTGFVLTDMNKVLHTDMILIDLYKAFDRLYHKLLLEKMTMLGFKTPGIKWFESYLSKRRFFVSVDDVFSEAGISNCCVLQGSIIGSVFLLMIL